MPTPSGERVLSHRVPYPDTVVQGRMSPLEFELVRDGVQVPLTEVESVQLVDRGGAVKFQQLTPPIVDGKVVVTVPAATSSDFLLGELYQTRWKAKTADDTIARTYRRPAVVALFVLSPPITDFDLTSGNYPDLVGQLASFANTGANGEATLQPYIDEAWATVLRRLFKVNRWPDLLFSTEDLVEPVREEAWFRVFRFLFSKASTDSRFEKLMGDHRHSADDAWKTMSSRFDNDADGLPDSEDRDAVTGAIQQNAAPRRRLRGRW